MMNDSGVVGKTGDYKTQTLAATNQARDPEQVKSQSNLWKG